MKNMAIAMLATAMIATPALAASNNQQQPQSGQMQNQTGASNNTQSRADGQQNRSDAQQHATNNQRQSMQPQSSAQNQPQGGAQQNQASDQQAANDQPIAPNSLPRSEVRQVQQALDKDGYHAGRVDGRWGPETENALKQYQQSKQIQANGHLNQQTLADLGVDTSRSQNQK